MFGKKKEVIENTSAEKVTQPDLTGHVTTIGKGITMVGNFEGKDPVEINGTVKGNIISKAGITVSESGTIDGEAAADNLTVYGKIKGIFKCDNTARFLSTGKLEGSLTAKELETAPGAQFKGSLNLAEQSNEAAKAEEIINDAVKAAEAEDTADSAE